jgi:dipeptidyl aminopeptidase/acylaminoacyl peptidase
VAQLSKKMTPCGKQAPASKQSPMLLLAMTIGCVIAGRGMCTAIVAKEIGGPVSRPQSRTITLADFSRIRTIRSLVPSPDGEKFVVFATQEDPAANTYTAGWYVGSVYGSVVQFSADGGQVSYTSTGTSVSGDIESRTAQWSNDGKYFAYIKRAGGESQLWLTGVDTGKSEQISHGRGDVERFAWNRENSAIYFSTSEARTERASRGAARERRGYHYDSELFSSDDLLSPEYPDLGRGPSAEFVVRLSDGLERPTTLVESGDYKAASAILEGGVETPRGYANNAVVPPIRRLDGTWAWLERVQPQSMVLRVLARGPDDRAREFTCDAPECVGQIKRIWWSQDGSRLFIWRRGGVNARRHSIYSWTVASRRVDKIFQTSDGDYLSKCALAAGNSLLCIRETLTQPSHVIKIDTETGRVQQIGDLNPELRDVKFGKITRIEWNSPSYAWNSSGGPLEGAYSSRAYGYIMYPPNYDPKKTYPAIIEPYVAWGFNGGDNNVEHPLHLYAAAGFIVLNLEFPWVSPDLGSRYPKNAMSMLYNRQLSFPHLTMYADSTIRGLDLAIRRGNIDPVRIGIGGVSHGTFVPLYIMQKYDRFSAVVISGPSWAANSFYLPTRIGREGAEQWAPKPEGSGREFWRDIETADHVEQLEAPILMNLAAKEASGTQRLIRNMADRELAYDAYVFTGETHIKWQPAHLYNIRQRNLDWFRFWLQDYEDPAPEKAEQYIRWRELRKLQCKNPRSLRKYCGLAH